jgi:general secretion pathway protein J
MSNKKLKGFTLLEILIALFIFTIVAVIMARALHIVFDSQATTEKHSVRLAELQIATLLLSRDLDQTINRVSVNAKGEPEAAFFGKTNFITFTHGGVADPTGQAQRSTLQRTTYIIQGKKFIREILPVLDPVQTSKPVQRTLLSNVRDGFFEFLDDKNVFHNSWPTDGQTQSQQQPRAVRVTLTLDGWGKITQMYLLAGQTNAPPKI